ncbi:colicin immunity domain-containing protein [uncultured Jatrophihabitans sp.]|uniref:colicin immunity domain-containing protein n=1 Tax=uncultured Jatrophihabitans sp. TaxID=1610747 RepID=UPI0035C9DF0A
MDLNDSEAAEVRSYFQPIHHLLRDFVDGSLEPGQFEESFFVAYPELKGELSHEAFMTTEWLFGLVEEWNAEERLRDEGALTTEELRRQIGELLDRLDSSGSGSRASA